MAGDQYPRDVYCLFAVCLAICWSLCIQLQGISLHYFIIVRKKIILMFCNLQQLVQSKSFLALMKSCQQQCTMTQPALQLLMWSGLHQKPLSHAL